MAPSHAPIGPDSLPSLGSPWRSFSGYCEPPKKVDVPQRTAVLERASNEKSGRLDEQEAALGEVRRQAR